MRAADLQMSACLASAGFDRIEGSYIEGIRGGWMSLPPKEARLTRTRLQSPFLSTNMF